MLLDFEYLFKKYNLNSKGVLHVGASTGQEAIRYDQLGIENAIFVEAIPDVFWQLAYSLAKHFPKYRAINACITDRDGDLVEFNISSNGGQSSSIYEFGVHKTCHPDVTFVDRIKLTTSRIDTVLNSIGVDFENNFDFINFDIQGAELLALKGMGDLLRHVKAAYLEVNKQPTYIGCALVEEVDEYMATFGFKRVETTGWIGDTWADAFYLKDSNHE